MKKVKRIITSDSTCDLSPEIIHEYNIKIFPIKVILGEKTFSDGIDIKPQDVFDYAKSTGDLPKTAAANVFEYTEFFEKTLEHCDEIIHINLSSGASSLFDVASEAAKSFGGRVRAIDSKALSTGQGLVVMKAVELTEEGKSLDETVDKLNQIKAEVNTSFVLDTLEYLHKGGRCSLVAMLGAKLLSLHPFINMVDGRLTAKKKYMGSLKKCIKNYIDDLARLYPNYDKKLCFITHSCCDAEIIEGIKKLLSEKFEFETVIETIAGSVVTSHCGRGTAGVLFFKNKV